MSSETASQQAPWLLLIHQIPPQPTGLRVRIWRRLQVLGSVAIKNSVYVLPPTDQAREDFEWIVREIAEHGGEASICEARFVEGLRDEQVRALFHAARDAEYAEIVEEARSIAGDVKVARGAESAPQLGTDITRLRRRLADIIAIDFFAAPGREAAEDALERLEGRALAPAQAASPRANLAELRGKTWVTRKGVHIDRIASVWLIRRFIDPDAKFRFVTARGYRPSPGELRFDMFEAEYTHEGDRCTFEVLVAAIGVRDTALRAVAEIVHDIDLKDAKFARPEAVGIDRLIAGLAMAHADDGERLARGAAVFDDLYEYFRKTARIGAKRGT